MDTRSRWERWATAVFVAAPIASVVLSAVNWLRYGIELPFYDDFRAYARGTALSLDPRDLFMPANDTLYPVGMALDALAQRFLDGSAIAYQFISMVVLLGGLLFLQWRLLSTTMRDRLTAAAAFALCIFLTWPESYWGLQSMAYHHGLPLLFLLGALTVVVDRGWAPWWGVPAVFILGLLAGFSYISGAFASLAVAIALVAAAALGVPRVTGLRAGGFALLTAAAIAVPAQVWVILFAQRGRIHDPRVEWLLPTESSFWMFLLGKIGRGLALPYYQPILSLSVTLAVVALVGALAAYLARRVWRERAALPEETARIAVVFFSLAAMIASYLPMIAAARANIMAPKTPSLVAWFIHGMPEHYHAVWVTLLIPWIAAVLLSMGGAITIPRLRNSSIALLGAAAFVTAAGTAGAFSHATYFRGAQTFRLYTDVPCIRKALAEEVVACPEFYGPELIDVLRYGRQIGSSYLRYFPHPPVPIGSNNPPPLFRLSEDAIGLELESTAQLESAEGLAFAASVDPRFFISLPAGSLRSCWELEVNIELKTERDDFAELYTLAPNEKDFKHPPTSLAQVRSGRYSTVTLTATDDRGFEDRLRLDPVGHTQAFTVRNLEVRCRASVPARSG